jgi:hypothetical protein
MDNTPGAGIAGVQLLNEDGSRQNSIDNFPSLETEILNKSILRLISPINIRVKPGIIILQSRWIQ